ncbi:MAG TPA: transposase [Terriglobales bacterium]|nr:transposase [Terriglobales bacterium]
MHFSRQVVGRFVGSRLTTDGGVLLVRREDRKIGLLRRLVACFTDARQPERIEHELSECWRSASTAGAGLRRPERSRGAAP